MTEYHHDLASRADKILTFEVGHKLAAYAADALGHCFDIPASAPNISAEDKRQLCRRRHLFDSDHVGFSPPSLAATLIKRTGGKSRVAQTMRDVLGLENPRDLAANLAEIGRADRSLLLLAMEGRLASAAIAVPTRGIGESTAEEVMDVLESLGGYHLLANLIRAGEDGFRRVFEPTGHNQLDYNDGMITSEASAARYLMNEAARTLPVLKLYRAAKSRALTVAEVEQLEALPEISIARAEEARVREALGEGAEGYVDLLASRALPWTRYIGRYAGQFGRAPNAYRRPLHRRHGPDVLTMLWLVVKQAVAWVSLRRGEVTPLRHALTAARNSGRIAQPRPHKQDVGDVKSLFFLLRNYLVRDPRAPAINELSRRKGASLDMVTDMMWRRETSRHAGAEPLSHSASTSAHALLAQIKKDPDRPEHLRIRREMAGSILIQLSV